ncbi:MAG: hypothetical protein IJ719_00330 [Clostridia bacterium]|nr:hypothetical protein [Clostridia bacterium]
MSNTALIETCRALLQDKTPLASNCGRLCRAACCQGDSTTGMILFPGEAELYEQCSFGEILPLSEPIGPADKLLVCGGTCPRSERPLACRLFPLFLRPKDPPMLIFDPRATMCPLCQGQPRLQRSFIMTAHQVYARLMEDPECQSFLRALDRELFGLF